MEVKRVKKIFMSISLFTILFSSTLSVSEAHPGRTDSSGGHTCRTNCESYGLEYGEYHYHNGGSSSSSSSSYAEQQREAEREAQRQAEEQRKREEQQRIQNEQSKKQGYDAGYQAGLSSGQKQSEFNSSVDNSNAFYQQGYSEGYQKGYDEGELKFLEEQRIKAEEEKKKAEEQIRLAEEKRKKEEFLAVIYDAGVKDGSNAYENNKGITEYPESIESYNEEQKQKYIEGFKKGWNEEKTYQENGGVISPIIGILIFLGLLGLIAWFIIKLFVRKSSVPNRSYYQPFNNYQGNIQQAFQDSMNDNSNTPQNSNNSNKNQEVMVKKGLFGCLGCLGIILVFGILFSGCVALFSTTETPEHEVTPEVVTVENQK